jgi:hypothetical protein
MYLFITARRVPLVSKRLYGLHFDTLNALLDERCIEASEKYRCLQ